MQQQAGWYLLRLKLLQISANLQIIEHEKLAKWGASWHRKHWGSQRETRWHWCELKTYIDMPLICCSIIPQPQYTSNSSTIMYFTTLSCLAVGILASPLVERQSSCPSIHIFGGRETTAPSGYGSSATFVNLILKAYSGSTAEAVDYPAIGGNSYAYSVQTGTKNVANQINSFNQRCPNTRLVYVGYSQVRTQSLFRSLLTIQGAEIADNAICGGGDFNQGVTNTNVLLSSGAQKQLKAVIWAGNPRHSAGQPFNVGGCNAGGVSRSSVVKSCWYWKFDARPNGFSCPPYSSLIRSYCDPSDPYCCNGNNANTHNGYGAEYGQNALAFVKSKLG